MFYNNTPSNKNLRRKWLKKIKAGVSQIDLFEFNNDVLLWMMNKKKNGGSDISISPEPFRSGVTPTGNFEK